MKRIISLFLALCAAAALLCPSAQAAPPKEDYIAANHTKSNGKPYYIMVNRAQSTVTIYGLDDSGYYTVPVKAMICSTGRKGHATPLGTYSIGGRWTWIHMLDNSYGQYCTQIRGNILFHSVCYTKRDPSTLMTEEYNGLGAPASLGCVRLQTIDAKWIYDNCARGTKVTVYDGDSPGPLGKPERLVDHISDDQANGWDPTDPREDNPWHEILAAQAQDPAPEDSADPAPVPEPAAEPSTSPEPDPDPAVSRPPADEPASYAQTAQALYELSGETGRTHSSQVITWAVQHRLMDDMVRPGFDPSKPITRQELAVMFYRYETFYCRHSARGLGPIASFTDQTGIHLYARVPVRWALGNRLLQGVSDTLFQPDGPVSQAQLADIIQTYQQLH